MGVVIIDGKSFEAAEGASVLDTALANDIWIPSLCHNKFLSDYGACRLCLVETVRKGKSKVTASCTLPALDGTEIITKSDRLTRLRRLAMELILASCPNSEPVMEMAEKLGVKPGRLEPDQASDCIRCGLCVRACAELSGKQAISFTGRGTNRKVGTPFDEASADCILCGACVFVCPTGSRLLDLARISGRTPRELLSEFDADLRARGAIDRPFPQALPNVPAINRDACLRLNTGGCGVCEKVCKASAINYDDQDSDEKLDVGAVVVVPGFHEFIARGEYDFGYSRYPDVVTSMEFERILSASGPFSGHVRRRSDGAEPKKIAFLQCIGSRDISCRNRYCSSVCCMYAIKEAVVAKEHLKGLDVTIFFMDIRAFGKDFERYYERAKSEYGVKFVRARVSDVSRAAGESQLAVKYAAESGAVAEERFDMVVLSVGLEPGDRTAALARGLGVRTNQHGFIWTDPAQPLRTSRPGVFVGGAASGPKDIPETVTQASAAACEAGILLQSARGTLTKEKEYPVERDVSRDPVRVGVFVCHCGINIGGVVDVPDVTSFARTLKGVVYAEENIYTCSQDTQDHIRQVIAEQDLNRVVVASCSPRTHEALFQETLKEAGLNPHLFAMANIRDQCAWVHQNEPEAATAKARDLVQMAVARARLAEPLASVFLPMTHSALVIGGGLTGMTGALAIADQGFDVCLVEKSRTLGGHLRDLDCMPGGQDLQVMLKSLVKRTVNHPRISVHMGTVVREVRGFVGNYETILSNDIAFKHGVILVATGADEYQPNNEYGYGRSRRVVTQLEFSRLLKKGFPRKPRSIVMIQCVGSREEPRQYCSRVCCTRAIQNAIRARDLLPDTEIHVLYRDIRTYGERELYYAEARDKGVIFTRFDPENKPEVVFEKGAGPSVVFKDPVLGQQVDLNADYVVLSTGLVADADANDVLAKQLKVPINQDGFFMEAHAKLRPVEFATEGVYVAGLAHGPKAVDESLAQALAAASRACVLLSKKELEAHGTVSTVNVERCMACGLCEKLCAFSAISMELQHVGREERLLPMVNLALCKGCGVCASSCRSNAIVLKGSTEEQVIAEIMAL